MQYLGALLMAFLGVVFVHCSSKQAEISSNVDTTKVEIQSAFAENDSTKTNILKWKEIETSEYGTSFRFYTQNNSEMVVNQIKIDGFDLDKNEFFTRTAIEGTPFFQYQIKDDVKDKWFEMSIMVVKEENEFSGEGFVDVKTIVGIKPFLN